MAETLTAERDSRARDWVGRTTAVRWVVVAILGSRNPVVLKSGGFRRGSRNDSTTAAVFNTDEEDKAGADVLAVATASCL